MKKFVKALDFSGKCFLYIRSSFPGLSDAKIEGGIFTGPEIRRLMKYKAFVCHMNEKEKEARQSFVAVYKNFLGNNKAPNYDIMVETMLKNFKVLEANMSIKLHYLHSHLDKFAENLGAMSERAHQDLSTIEKRYQGRWDIAMLADCMGLEARLPMCKFI